MGVSAGHVVQPIFSKPNRSPEFTREVRHKDRVLYTPFHTVAAADIVGGHPQIVGGDAENCGEVLLLAHHAAGAGMDLVATGLGIVGRGLLARLGAGLGGGAGGGGLPPQCPTAKMLR